MSDEVAYVECLEAQEALYWEARRRGWRLDDKAIGDLLRIAAPILRRQMRIEVLRDLLSLSVNGIEITTEALGELIDECEKAAMELGDQT